MRGVNARSILSKLVDSADTDASRRAAHVVREVIGVQPPSVVSANRKPKSTSTTKRAGVPASAAPAKAHGSSAAQGRTTIAKKRPARKPITKQRGRKQTARKVPTKRQAVKKRAPEDQAVRSAGRDQNGAARKAGAPAAKKRAGRATASKSP